MFYNTYRKRVAFLLLSVFSISTVGFSIDLHYCGGHLKSFSLVGKAKSCHENSLTKSCHSKKQEQSKCEDSIDKNECCNNSSTYSIMDYDAQLQLIVQKDNTTDTPIVFGHYFDEPTHVNKNVHFASYANPPPLSGVDIRVRLGSFLC